MAKFLSKYVEDGHRAIFALGNGEKLSVDIKGFSDDIREKLAMHGLLQKVGDAASGFSKDKNFAGAMAEMDAVSDALLDGVWTRKGGGTGISDLVQALANLTGKPLEDCQAVVDAMDDERMKVIRKRKDITAEIKRIQYERAKANAGDADDLGDLF